MSLKLLVEDLEKIDHHNLCEFMLSCVRQSCDSIQLELYNFEFSAYGQRFLSELEYACVRGVKVLMQIDSEGSMQFIEDHPTLLTMLETPVTVFQAKEKNRSVIAFDELCNVKFKGEHQGLWAGIPLRTEFQLFIEKYNKN